MSKYWPFFFGAIVSGLISSIQAQDATPLPAPKPPCVDKAPVSSSWTVRYPAPKAAGSSDSAIPPQVQQASPVSEIKEVEVTKSDKLRRVETSFWLGNRKMEMWYVGSYGLLSKTELPDIIIFSAHSSFGARSPIQNFNDSDFPDLSWISLESYVGEATVKGKKCYHFKGPEVIDGPVLPFASGTKLPPAPKPATLEAWIDPDTKLPIAATDTKGILRTYTFKEGAQEPLVLPDKFAKALELYKSREKR